MGSFVELNDTLQISKAQGFPAELDLTTHKAIPYETDMFKDRVFRFHAKKDIRCYQQPPVRCFLVENVDGEWIYWGLVFVLSIEHDYVNKTTAGTFKIVRIFKPEEIKTAKDLIEFRE